MVVPLSFVAATDAGEGFGTLAFGRALAMEDRKRQNFRDREKMKNEKAKYKTNPTQILLGNISLELLNR